MATDKTDLHNITETLLKEVLNANKSYIYIIFCQKSRRPAKYHIGEETQTTIKIRNTSLIIHVHKKTFNISLKN